MKALYLTILGLALYAPANAAPPGQGYRPQALREVISRSAELARAGRRPIVLFDLDDTLINTRERNLRILKDFASSIEKDSPGEAAKIRGLSPGGIHFLLAETLKGAGVTDPALVAKANDFWLARFFTNEYTAGDVPNPGAATYLREVTHAGALVVYLTGRDEPRMGDGTRESLARNHFPLCAGQATLLLKPDKNIDDLAFKVSQFAAVAGMGEVVAAFENEPANLNAMAAAFPQAEAIFLDTIHSPKPDVPVERASWVEDFRLPGAR